MSRFGLGPTDEEFWQREDELDEVEDAARLAEEEDEDEG